MSSVPAAVVRLHTIWTASTDLDGVIVHFGPPMREQGARERIAVAYSPGGGDVIDTSSDWAAMGQQAQEERYEVLCALTVWTGDSTEDAMQTTFLRAYALLNACAAAVGDDYTLGGAVREARISSHSTSVDQPDPGAAVELTFRVACAQRTSY